MTTVRKDGRFYQQRKLLVFSGLVLIFLLFIAALPSLLLKKSNAFLKEFSPNYSLHMEDLDLALSKGALRFDGILGELKESKQNFLNIQTIEVSIAWRELFKGKVLIDIHVENANLMVPKDIKKLYFKPKEAQDIKNTFFPLKIERVALQNSSLTFEKYKSLSGKGPLTVSAINGQVTNLTPTPELPLSPFRFTARIPEAGAEFKLDGKINRRDSPLSWSLDTEVKNVPLVALNPFLKAHLPLTFTKGSLDLYSEVLSEKGKARGYLKPFLKEVDVVANREKFVGAKHLGIEAVTALSNLILREKKTRSIATVIDFKYDKKLSFNLRGGLTEALKHGFESHLDPGVENKYQLK